MDPSSNTSAEIAQVADIEYVGFWARVGASLIDTLIALVVLAIIGKIFGLKPVDIQGDMDSVLAGSQFGSAEFLQHLGSAIVIVACWLKFAATPGKRVIGAEVVDAKTLGPLRPGQAILRYACYYLSLIPLCLGFFWVGFDPRKQGWHDKIAGTLVIKKR